MISSTVLLTGAAHGIGRATALALASEGATLILVDRDETALRELGMLLEQSGTRFQTAAMDVRDRHAMIDFVSRIETEMGPIHVLIACAGVGGLTSVAALDVEGFRSMLEVNVLGVAHAIDAVLPGMIRQRSGHIVGISSVAGFRGMPWMASYSASKAALSIYLEGLRPAFKLRGIAITTVCPGFVKTAITRDTPFRQPVAMMEPEEAARHLVRVLKKRPRTHVFPFGTSLGMKFLKLLPDPIFDWMMDRAGPRMLTTEF